MLYAAKVAVTCQPGITVLGAGTTFKGDVDVGSGGLRAEGTVEGTIACEGTVTVLPAGLVRGTILARRLVVSGRVEGTFKVTGCLEVHGSGWVEGEMRMGILVVDEGTTLQGRCGHLEDELGGSPARPGTRPGPAGDGGTGRPVLRMVLAVVAGIALFLAARFAYHRYRQDAASVPVPAGAAFAPVAPVSAAQPARAAGGPASARKPAPGPAAARAIPKPAAGPVAAHPVRPRSEPGPAASQPRTKFAPQETPLQKVPTPAPGRATEDQPEPSAP